VSERERERERGGGREKAIAEQAHLPARLSRPSALPTRFISLPVKQKSEETEEREDPRRCAGHKSPVAATGDVARTRYPADEDSAF